jgi:DNA-binding CsgD family transcriptional regulator
MGKPNSARKLERREKILVLMSRGMNQINIAKELGVARNTIIRDMKHVNEMTKHGLYDLARSTLSTMYFNCLQGMDECLNECWRIYRKEDNDPETNKWHRIAALRLISVINEKKFNIFSNGPAYMQIDNANTEIGKLKKDLIDDMNRERGIFKKPLTDID